MRECGGRGGGTVAPRGIPPPRPHSHSHSFCDTASSTAGIRALLRAFPSAVRHKRPKDGALPLAITASRGCSAACVSAVLDEWPEAAQALDSKGRSVLLVACGGATLETVELLLDARPDAVRLPCTAGRLPLHAALDLPRAGERAAVVARLVAEYPEAAAVKNPLSNGMLPLHGGAWKGLPLAVLRALAAAHPPAAAEISPTHFLAGPPVLYAVWGATEQPSAARFLLGAAPAPELSLRASTYRGVTALHMVRAGGPPCVPRGKCSDAPTTPPRAHPRPSRARSSPSGPTPCAPRRCLARCPSSPSSRATPRRTRPSSRSSRRTGTPWRRATRATAARPCTWPVAPSSTCGT